MHRWCLGLCCCVFDIAASEPLPRPIHDLTERGAGALQVHPFAAARVKQPGYDRIAVTDVIIGTVAGVQPGLLAIIVRDRFNVVRHASAVVPEADVRLQIGA